MKENKFKNTATWLTSTFNLVGEGIVVTPAGQVHHQTLEALTRPEN
jgi:hypothetical protein